MTINGSGNRVVYNEQNCESDTKIPPPQEVEYQRRAWAEHESAKSKMRERLCGLQQHKPEWTDLLAINESEKVAVRVKAMALERMGEYAQTTMEYMSNVANKTACIMAPAGCGKTRHAANMLSILTLSQQKRVVVVAHQNVAVNRINETSVHEVSALVKTYNDNRPEGMSLLELPVMVLGTDKTEDVTCFREIVTGKHVDDTADRTSKFQLMLSPCHWMLMALEVDKYKLPVNCNQEIVALRDGLRDSHDAKRVRDFESGETTWDDARKGITDDDKTHPISVLKDSFNYIRQAAVAIFITTSYSTNSNWKRYVKQADVVLNDEAAAFSISNMLIALHRPDVIYIAYGDRKQLSPWVRQLMLPSKFGGQVDAQIENKGNSTEAVNMVDQTETSGTGNQDGTCWQEQPDNI